MHRLATSYQRVHFIMAHSWIFLIELGLSKNCHTQNRLISQLLK
jgi:hypothetical protein